LKENQHTEFESGFNDEVIETLTAFANAKGRRVLICLANNGLPVKGFASGKESIRKWLNEIKTKTQPAIIRSIENIAD
jgi:ATP-dependent DNA helicase RecG